MCTPRNAEANVYHKWPLEESRTNLQSSFTEATPATLAGGRIEDALGDTTWFDTTLVKICWVDSKARSSTRVCDFFLCSVKIKERLCSRVLATEGQN